MARRHRTQRRDISPAPHGAAAASADNSAQPTDHFRHALLGAAAAILVARPLVPSDGGAWIGDGQIAAALWIALAALWAVQSLGQPRLQVRFGWIDATMVAFVGWWSVAALMGAAHAAPRPSINMLWEGVASLLTFLLLRQLVEPNGLSSERMGTGSEPLATTSAKQASCEVPVPILSRPGKSREARALVAVMIAVGVILAIFAIYQYFVTMPAERQRFVKHPAAVFREAQVEWAAPGTQEFRRFADRLNSPEPTATFDLTNSLAAFLAPWLVIAIGMATFGWGVLRSRPEQRWNWWRLVACAIPIAIGLALTHSRSAWIGVGVGFACLAIWRGGRKLAIAVLIVTILAGAAVAAPRQVLPPAMRQARDRASVSFQVRIDYWRATRVMIADHPWWGFGPGNFADYYTQYKLPAGTEEVRDPHNFALEIAVSAGLPALILFLTVLAGFAYRLWRHGGITAGTAEEKTGTTPSADGTWWILGGAIVGLGAAIFWRIITGFPAFEEETVVGLFAAGATWWLLWPWIRNGVLPPRLCGVGVLVLLVALLAVGGMTFGGVNETLWLLLALGLNATELGSDQKKSLPWIMNVVLLAVVVVLWFAQHQSAYEPMLGCERALDAARGYLAERDQANLERQLLDAAAADPFAVDPRRLLAALRLEQLQQEEKQPQPNGQLASKLIADFQNWMNQAIALEPQSAGLCGQAGAGWRQIFAVTKVPADGRRAVEFCRRAAELYPTGVLIQLELAETLSATGDSAGAAAAAGEALRLDDLRLAAERALDDEQRKLAERIILGDNHSDVGERK